jgi:hypothetical protein
VTTKIITGSTWSMVQFSEYISISPVGRVYSAPTLPWFSHEVDCFKSRLIDEVKRHGRGGHDGQGIWDIDSLALAAAVCTVYRCTALYVV